MNRSDGEPAARWYVAETAPRKEQLALLNLERQAFRSVCPRFVRKRRHARRTDNVLTPFFPGYVFIRFNRDRDHWSAINGTLGVRRLIGSRPSHPQAMPEAVMDALLARCDGAVNGPAGPALQLGASVRLIDGPFAEQVATIESLGDRDRVRVLLNILGGAVPVQVRAKDLAPL